MRALVLGDDLVEHPAPQLPRRRPVRSSARPGPYRPWPAPAPCSTARSRKNGHRRYRSRSTSSRPSPSSIHSSNAVPVPYQPGSITRDWLQASTHGMARRSEIWRGRLARGRPAADVERADLADRRRRLEVLDESRCLVHQFGVRPLGPGGQLVEHLVGGLGGVAEALDVEQGRLPASRPAASPGCGARSAVRRTWRRSPHPAR